ncbi:hypothetical protein PIROE2DRAFT_3340 [Piromyces sp. E2]|nr:hypothetical protein PIROE2DRAFT_3340 [Piromyces sp. E2]|eukprot:OUM68822.1 hypothetical protein PIROE2DRAFT_3340 [Piromyces sp. E2]
MFTSITEYGEITEIKLDKRFIENESTLKTSCNKSKILMESYNDIKICDDNGNYSDGSFVATKKIISKIINCHYKETCD